MKSLSSTLSCCKGPKCVSSNNDTKALCQVSIILITRPKNHLLTNKLLFDIIYNEMKSLNSIFSWCNGVKIVVLWKDRLALSHGDNHFDLLLITLAENHLHKLVTH